MKKIKKKVFIKKCINIYYYTLILCNKIYLYIIIMSLYQDVYNFVSNYAKFY